MTQGKETDTARHDALCHELHDLYTRKNHDYGDSFHKTWMEEGAAVARIRLTDKLNRLKTLTKGTRKAVNSESVRDTVMDIAGYALLTVMELDREAMEANGGVN